MKQYVIIKNNIKCLLYKIFKKYWQLFYDWYLRYYYLRNVKTVGNPTITDNTIVSGFTNTQGLKIPNAFKPESKPWEMVIKFKLTATNNVNSLYGQAGNNRTTPQIEISDNGKSWMGISYDTTSWNIGQNGSVTYAANIWYWIKFQFTGKTYSVYYSTDGINYNLDQSVSSTTAVYQADDSLFSIGYENGGASNRYMNGLIDLSECYININGVRWWSGIDFDTKPLQKVNAEIIGTPSVNNGIVSNFGIKNYLLTPKAFQPASYPWEMVWKIETSASVPTVSSRIIGNYGTNYISPQIQWRNDNKFDAILSFNGTSWNALIPDHAVKTNTIYRLKLEFTGSAYNFYISETNVFNTKPDASLSSSTAIYTTADSRIEIGQDQEITTSNVSWPASIDLSESYININGVRWWNGTTDTYDWTQDVIVSENTRTHDGNYAYKILSDKTKATADDFDEQETIKQPHLLRKKQ